MKHTKTLFFAILFCCIGLFAALSPSRVYAASNTYLDGASEVKEGPRHMCFYTTWEEPGWDRDRWYVFTPETTDYYKIELDYPIYMGDDADSSITLYSSYKNAENGDAMVYRDLAFSARQIGFTKKLKKGQKYYIHVHIAADYACATDFDMVLEISHDLDPKADVLFPEKEITYVAGKLGVKKSFTLTWGSAKSWKSSNKNVLEITSSDSKNVTYKIKGLGKADIIVTDKDGLTKKCTVTVRPPRTTLKELTAGTKSVTVKWNKMEKKVGDGHISGYQIQIATDDKFTQNKKSYLCSGYTKVQRTIKDLKSGKKYYVRIRTYKKVGDKRYYSAWSATKSIKTKSS